MTYLREESCFASFSEKNCLLALADGKGRLWTLKDGKRL
jgi:hypothetical protein